MMAAFLLEYVQEDLGTTLNPFTVSKAFNQPLS